MPSSLSTDIDLTGRALDDVASALAKSLSDAQSGSFRRQLAQLVRVIQATCLLRSADRAVSAAFIQIHLVPKDLVNEPSWLPFLDAVLA
jgi:hypothetical protein